MLARLLLILMIVTYGMLFQSHEEQSNKIEPHLSQALPAPVQEVILGYLKEFGAEMLFIKTAAFWGRNDLPENHEEYVDSLAQNFHVMTDIYPEFIDPYYLTESSLSYINYTSASNANDILSKGVSSHPDNIIFPFFRAFNYFYYMDQPKAAAAIFSDLATRPDAPAWFGHLAGILSARGGDLYGGLMTLKAMLSTEEDEAMKERYQHDIVIFENAIRVHEATQAFFLKNGHYPLNLNDLVPQFLSQLPNFDDGYSLKWDSPDLRLIRPLKKSELN